MVDRFQVDLHPQLMRLTTKPPQRNLSLLITTYECLFTAHESQSDTLLNTKMYYKIMYVFMKCMYEFIFCIHKNICSS